MSDRVECSDQYEMLHDVQEYSAIAQDMLDCDVDTREVTGLLAAALRTSIVNMPIGIVGGEVEQCHLVDDGAAIAAVYYANDGIVEGCYEGIALRYQTLEIQGEPYASRRLCHVVRGETTQYDGFDGTDFQTTPRTYVTVEGATPYILSNVYAHTLNEDLAPGARSAEAISALDEVLYSEHLKPIEKLGKTALLLRYDWSKFMNIETRAQAYRNISYVNAVGEFVGMQVLSNLFYVNEDSGDTTVVRLPADEALLSEVESLDFCRGFNYTRGVSTDKIVLSVESTTPAGTSISVPILRGNILAMVHRERATA